MDESPSVAVCLAAALSVAASLVHLWAAPQIYVDLWGYGTPLWWGYPALYALIAAFQGLYGVVLLRWPTQPVFMVGLAGALAAILLYVATRTVGVPFGPTAGRVEEMGLLDLLGTAAAVGVVVSLLAVLQRRHREKAVTALLFVVAAAWALRLLGVIS